MNVMIDRAIAGHAAGSPVDLLVGLFLIGMLPVLAVSLTSFTRVIVVLGLLRSALGSPSLPPNVVLTSLAIMLTGAIMAPTLARIGDTAMKPYAEHRLPPSAAIAQGAIPLRDFMMKNTRPTELEAFARMEHVTIDRKQPQIAVVAPAFLVSELRAAFAMGFALALPFAVVDIVVSAVLMSLGMYMVSPAAIATPLKLLLFVLADGWTLVAGALVASYR